VKQTHNLPKLEGFSMKNTITKKSVLSKVALFALMTTTSYIGAQDISADIINNVRSEFIAPTLEDFKNFFDSKISTPFNTFVVHIKNTKREFNNKLAQFETTISESNQESTLPGLCLAFAHQIQPKFNRILNILEKYNGKKPDQATAFSNELLQEFDADLMFKEITAQLTTLFNQAKAENNKPLMKSINDLISFLKHKKTEMNKKSDKLSLFTGIVTRMRS
jgi:hypothetical protein